MQRSVCLSYLAWRVFRESIEAFSGSPAAAEPRFHGNVGPLLGVGNTQIFPLLKRVPLLNAHLEFMVGQGCVQVISCAQNTN